MARRSPTVPPELAREREVRAWAMATQGKSQSEIAVALEITQPGVSKILARVSARVLKTLEQTVQQQKASQDARLEHIINESLTAWERSKKPRQKSRTTEKTSLSALVNDQAAIPGGRRTETLKEALTSNGDAAYLNTALAALGDKAKLWGLNAAKKIDLVDKRRPLEKLTDEQLQDRLRENAAILGNGD